MASWNKDRVEPNAINGGREFTTDDNLALNELNAIVNNSFYASEKSAEALGKINDIIEHEQGTVVTINDNPQAEWEADFAESERQKSKNLLYLKQQDYTLLNINVKINSQTQELTFNGISDGLNESFIAFVEPFTLKAGKTYTFSATQMAGNLTGPLSIMLYDTGKGLWTDIFGIGLVGDRKNTITPTNDLTFNALRWYVDTGTNTSNYTIKLQVEENNQATDWQYPYGEIAHKNEILKDFWSGITENNTWVELEIGNNINLINEYGFQGRYSRNIEKTANGLVIKKTGYYFVDFNTSIERTDSTTVNVYIEVKKNDFVNMARQSNRTGDNLRELVASSGIIYCNSGDIITLNLVRDNDNATGKIINLNFTIREV